MKRVSRLLYPRGPVGVWVPALAALVLMLSAAVTLSGWHLNTPWNAAQQILQSRWQKWLENDVVYIISAGEKVAFEGLKKDEERQSFVEQFWLRRDPTFGTSANEYQEEHYRRIAYANDHWGGRSAGWRTDRGRIYIRYGPPDEIDAHLVGGKYERAASKGGPALTYPFEDWLYAHFDGAGRLAIEFVGSDGSGELRLTLNPNDKFRKP